MHESHFVDSIINAIKKQADAEAAKKVIKVHFNFGQFCGYSPEHLKFHFDEAAKGTIAEGAELIFNNIPQSADISLESIDIE